MIHPHDDHHKLDVSGYGEIRRTATGDAPLPRIGCPAAPVPQPAMLMIIVFTWPIFGGEFDMPSGFRNS